MSAPLALHPADRERIETAIELLVRILDAVDAPSADMEPDNDDMGADDFGEEDDFGEPDYTKADHPPYGDDQRVMLAPHHILGHVERWRTD